MVTLICYKNALKDANGRMKLSLAVVLSLFIVSLVLFTHTCTAADDEPFGEYDEEFDFDLEEVEDELHNPPPEVL